MAKNSSAIVSDDCQHVAIPRQRGFRWTVLYDGVEGPTHPAVHSLTFSQSGGRFAYVANKGLNQDVLVLDGKEGPIQNIAPNSLKFSPNGLRYAYMIGVSNSTGESSLMFDVDEKGALPAGSNVTGKKRMRYGGSTRVVVDGKESRDYYSAATRNILFSPDSRHVAYHASASQRPTLLDLSVVVRDGVESKPYVAILNGTPVFSPDSQHLAFAGERDGKWMVVRDGKESEPYDGIDDSSLVFSPDSLRLAYRAKRGDRWFAVVDGKEIRPAEDGVSSGWVVFSPDNQRMAVGVFRVNKQNWLIDGKFDPTFDSVAKLTFSPNNQRFTYPGARGNQWYAVTDGVESRGYEMIINSPGTPFSPDSRHVAYLTKRDGKFRLLLDGKEGSEYDYVDRSLAFSPDSRHVAFLAGRGPVVAPGDQGKDVVVVVDERETKPYVGIFPCVAFVGSSTVRVIAVRMNFETANYELVRVEVSVPEP
jgi:WD40 repeat protein